jgi:mono/diheme cytochrome c family protein
MRFLAFLGAVALLFAIGAAGFFFGGFYDVSAVAPEPQIVHWALERVRNASIAQHAPERASIALNDDARVRDGARAFANRGCATCHGAPGGDWAKFAEAMRPDPPDLAEIAPSLTTPEIFWVVKNGINMTAMPGFARIDVGDPELWAIAAFVKALPHVKDADFKAWTATP